MIDAYKIKRYGSLSAEHLNGDKIAYANQASAGHLFLCFPGQDTIVKAYLVEGTPHHKKKSHMKNLNVILVGFGTRNEDGYPEHISLEALSKVVPTLQGVHLFEKELQVKFDLKYSYFDRLHLAIDSLARNIVEKIMPQNTSDFSKPSRSENARSSTALPYNYKEVIGLDDLQERALRTALTCEPKAPIIIIGSFGTGKTRLLAHLAFQSKGSARILIVAHHQASADTFIYSYFGKMDWKADVCRLIAPRYKYDKQYSKFYNTATEIKQSRMLPQVIVTTLSTSLHLQAYMRKTREYFTHILMDEGAQTREPESVAPLCMARSDTKIIITGDHKQV